MILERRTPGGFAVRPAHVRARQFFFGLSGTLALRLDGVVHALGAQERVEVPPQALNRPGGPLEFLVTSQPPARGDPDAGAVRSRLNRFIPLLP